MLPNLIEYFLTGIKHSEYTSAATSQLYNMKCKTWAEPLLDKLGIPKNLFTPVDLAGRILGSLSPAVEQEIDCRNLNVVSVAGHDTASAALAVPTRCKEFTFISSGTWSLLCVCSVRLLEDESIIPKKITNEGNWDGSYRPTINISGLWILQQCHKQWNSTGKTYSYDTLEKMAKRAKKLRSFIRPEDFEKIGDYPSMIRDFCRKSNQPVPEGIGEITLCILESLALKYRQVYGLLSTHVPQRKAIYVVGGGVRNHLLNQFTANALNMPVVAGLAEAATVGNALVQLEALGELRGADQRSSIIENSFTSEVFMPHDRDEWDEAYNRFQRLYE
jgi:sugar (pentulose or hexulose) kinase